MKIQELIDQLEGARLVHGNIECLVEIVNDDVFCMMPVDGLSFEDREGYGESIAILQ